MFSSPWLSALVVVVVMAAVLGLALGLDRARSRRRGTRRATQWRQRLPLALIAGAVACLVVAFAQVRLNRQVTHGTVVLAIDVSRSMSATDVAPNRLVAAEVAAKAFLQQLPAGFRVGLVTFAAEPAVAVSPTADRTQVQGAVDALATPPQYGTVIGDGLSAAIDAIQADRGEVGDGPAAVVLLSDGRDSGSRIPPDEAAVRAEQLGIPVFTVAIGGSGSGASPATESPAAGSPIEAASTDLLRRIAETTGARTFTTTSADQLTQVYESLGSRLSYELAVGSNAGPFVVLAVVLTLAAAALVLLDARDPYSQPRTAKRRPTR